MEAWRPANESDLREAVAWAAAEKTPLRILGAGTKGDFGKPVAAERILDVARLSGVTLYEPGELVLRARAGTPLREIEDTLAKKEQCLAFEPRDLGPLFGAPAGRATLGGIVSTNLAGPRRFKAGAVRDHVLGITAVNGRGEIFKSGGRVMKNVTGYDLPKLVTGAFGTLGVLTETTLKVVPSPQDTRTLILAGLDDRAAIGVLRDALSSMHEVSGAAHLPANVARRSQVAPVAQVQGAVTALRLEGAPAGVEARLHALLARFRRPGFYLGPLAERGGAAVLEAQDSKALWAEIRDVSFFAGLEGPVWRVSTAPVNGPAVAAAVGAQMWFYDWAGGLLWLLVGEAPRAEEPLMRRAALAAGGHATLVRASPAQREALEVFQPQPPALAALTRRIKDSFDPLKIFNPGLMYAGV